MNGKTYTKGLGTVVEVEVVAVGTVEAGSAATVDVGAIDVDGATVDSCVAPSAAHAAASTQSAINDRAVVRRALTGDLPLCPMRKFGGLGIGVTVLGLTMLVAGCNIDGGSATPDTLAPLGTPSNTVPPPTVTTVAESIVEVPTSTIVLPGGACVFSAAPPTPEVTFEVGTRLYTINSADSTTTCLTEVTLDNLGPLRWSPAGDRVLLNSVTVFDGTQALPSGYFATNTRVSWSYPTGRALIAPAVADNHLLWRTAGAPETRTDISFLEQTDVAVYHPAGRNIFAAGRASDGTTGLFVAGNRGENPRVIARNADPNTLITEIGPDPSGALVYFVDDHGNGTFHVHAVTLPALGITNVAESAEPLARLTIGTVANAAIAWRIGDCAGLTRTQIFRGQAVVDEPSVFAALSTEPIGWLDTDHLVVSVRSTGCTGPSDLWVWNIGNSAATPLITGVDSAAIRSVLTVFGELPGAPNAAAQE
ncbi:MAG TPA: hypothetical protein VHN36_03630 [Ilumatobacteraceae bacterium]|nr:hypothetical protein [Ilumatobacteraceae bacterium]